VSLTTHKQLFSDYATARETPMNTQPNKLTLEWVESPNDVALVFDKRTWRIFEQAANREDRSAKHMITRAVVGCLGSIREDNMMLNQILHGSG
jgi:hypothetical protein